MVPVGASVIISQKTEMLNLVAENYPGKIKFIIYKN